METNKLNDPILIAAWPGMGHVAATACYYLIAKLQMEFRAEYATSELFDADHVTVESGLVEPFRYPKNQMFAWQNPDAGGPDLMVFIGEAQPPVGRYDFCRKLIDYAQREGVSKVFTFAAMATASELLDESRVVGAATDTGTLDQFLESQIGLLQSGRISGMNGILLGVAAERKMEGGCLLGEMPAMFSAVPYPKASIAVLNAFRRLTSIEVEMSQLTLEAERMEAHLSSAVDQMKKLHHENQEEDPLEEDETYLPDPMDNDKLSPDEKATIESLFAQAELDRTKAFELKQELDRLNVFRDYEDRFLDLFKDGGQ
ncbi:MAG: PAC2 family protein [Planctomycetota bacterium]